MKHWSLLDISIVTMHRVATTFLELQILIARQFMIIFLFEN